MEYRIKKKRVRTDNILIMIKKNLSVLLIFSVLLCFSGCHRENRFDFSELMRRMESFDERIVFDTQKAFFSKGEWFVFLSVAEEDDIIVSAKEDENTGYITSVSVSTVNTGKESDSKVFLDVCVAAADAFIFGTDKKDALEGVGLFNENVIFSENTYFYETGRFNLSFFNADMGSTLIIDIS